MITAYDLRAGITRALESRDRPLPNLTELPEPIRASGIASCGRRQTIIRTVPDLPPSQIGEEGLFQMLQGDWAEAGMEKLLAECGWQFKDRQRAMEYMNEAGEIVLRGHMEGLMGFGPVPTEWYLWENKAMSAYRYRKLSTARSVLSECPEYYDQVQVYMGLLEQTTNPVPYCLFTAVAKDPSAVNMGNKRGTPRLPPYYVEVIYPDYDRFDYLCGRAEALYEASLQGSLWRHERDPRSDWDCSERFCPVYQFCDPMATAPRR